MKTLCVTIMAAGEGKRMNSDIPKVLHTFMGVPMLVRIVLQTFKLNPTKIIIITGKHNDLIQTTVKKYTTDSRIIYVVQTESNGTGGAIKSTLDYYDENENILILNGDMPLITSEPLQKMLDQPKPCKIMIAELDNPTGYGRIVPIKTNDIISVEIREHKECSEEELGIKVVNVGIYLLDSDILKKYIPLIENNNSQKEYYLTDLLTIIRRFDINIETYMVDPQNITQIYGVNTMRELVLLEEYARL